MTDLERQLADELHRRVAWPAALLLGNDLYDTLTARIAERVPVLAAQLVQDQDDGLAAQTVIDLLGVLWPTGDPEACGEPDWWRTPLGQTCARSLGRDDAQSVSHSVAAAMLGVTRSTVSTMVRRGTLDRHPDGGVLRGSVLTRLAR